MGSVHFTTQLHKFDDMGEKTGWTFFDVSSKVAQKLSKGTKKSFRVKGRIDQFEINQIALIPMGEGDFIIPFNASMRKGTGKKVGDKVEVYLELDLEEKKISEDLLLCLGENQENLSHFLSLPKGHQNYYSNWIESAKTSNTKSDRIMKTIFAMENKMEYGEMIRHFSKK
jgi:hypothetical protein